MAVIFSFNGKTVAEFKHVLEGMLRDMCVKALRRKTIVNSQREKRELEIRAAAFLDAAELVRDIHLNKEEGR
jgi:hypothetical protein